jgi:hypothetical protein
MALTIIRRDKVFRDLPFGLATPLGQRRKVFLAVELARVQDFHKRLGLGGGNHLVSSSTFSGNAITQEMS